MPLQTIILAIILILLGAGAYVGSGMASVTALIPSFFGVAFLVCGALAFKQGLRKHVMHVAALLALLGIGGAGMGFAKLPSLFDGTAERPMAIIVQCIMSVLLVVYLVLCIRSFINARKARQAQEQ